MDSTSRDRVLFDQHSIASESYPNGGMGPLGEWMALS